MLNFGNKEFRNLEEAVQKNKEDIKGLKFGLNIVDHVDGPEYLPNISVEYGDAYLVGNDAPYSIYIYLGHWINMGTLQSTIPGPQGLQGEQGLQGVSIKDIRLQYLSGDMIIELSDGTIINLGSVKGPQGPQGLRGLKGDKGDKGSTGNIGPQGDPAFLLDQIRTDAQSTADLPTASLEYVHTGYIINSNLYICAATDNVLSGYQWTSIGTVIPSYSIDSVPTKNSSNPVASGGVYNQLSDKLTKVESSGTSNRVYAIASNGSQYIAKLTNSVVSGEHSIPLRDTNGNFKVGTPKADGDAANKAYVDSKLAPTIEADDFINQTNGIATMIANTYEESSNLVYARCFTGGDTNYITFNNHLYKINSDGSLELVLNQILSGTEANAENITMDYYDGIFIVAYRLLWGGKYQCRMSFFTINNGAKDKSYYHTVDASNNNYEPFIYREDNIVYILYCNEPTSKAYQDIKCEKFTILDNWNFDHESSFILLDHGLSKDIDGKTHTDERPGFPCIQRLIDGSLIMFYETNVNKSLNYPITINYLYFPNDKIEALEDKTFTGGTLIKFKDKPCTAPYISVKEDGRINLTFHSNYGYYGLDADIGIHEKVFYFYLSNMFVEKNQILKLRDFTNIPIDSVAKNKWIGGWGSNFTMVDGRTCVVYTRGHNTNASTSVSDGSIILILDAPNVAQTAYKTIFGNQSILGSGNIDLYIHSLTFNDNIYKEYPSSMNLVVDSIQDLNTLCKATDGCKIIIDRDTYIIYNYNVWKLNDGTLITKVSDSVRTI